MTLTFNPETPEVSTDNGTITWIFDCAGIVSGVAEGALTFALVGNISKLTFTLFGKPLVRVIGID